MGAHVIADDPAIREDAEKDINGVVSECAAIVREDRWPTGVVEEDVRQQSMCDARCFIGRVAPGVLERMSKDRDELSIVFRLTGKEVSFAIAGEEDRLRRSSPSVGLNPRAIGAVYRAMLEPDGIGAQCGVRNFEDNAADVFCREEIDAGELELVEGPFRIEKEGVAAPAREDAVIAGLRHVCRLACRDRHSLDDQVTAVACLSGLCTLETIDGSGLRTAVGRRESHAVSYVGDSVAVGVDLELIDRIRRKGLDRGRSGRVNADGRMRVHHEDCLAGSFGAGEGVEISKVEAGVAVRKTEVRTGVMVRHRRPPLLSFGGPNCDPDQE